MITYYLKDNTQKHLVGTKDDHVIYLSVFKQKNQILIDGDFFSLDVKYGPDLECPHLTRHNAVPAELVYLLEYL